jgi:hypothetical protein
MAKKEPKQKKPSKIKVILAKLGNSIGEALGNAFMNRS